MATIYDSASLVMIPTGYKEDKVYSIKPTDGSGDLDFTRSNDTATRVGADGLIEKVRTNLVTHSEDWTNAAWTKTNVTVTANSTTNPIDGASTADAIFETTTSGQHNFFQAFTTSTGNEVTISFFAKANGRTKMRMNNGSSAITAAFDLTAVTASMLAGAGTPTITSVGSGWFRCSLTHNAAATTQFVAMNLRDDADQDVYAGDITKGMFFFGGQAESGVATPYIPTTTAAVSVGPVADLPRLDYSGGASCPSLLLEPQRTNLLTYSEQFDDADWAKSETTISANAVTSPDGFTDADNIVENTSAGAHGVGNLTGLTLTAVPYTFSAFVKKQTRTFFNISTFDGSTTLDGYFNLTTGAVGTMPAGMTGTITDYGNDWYRCTATRTMGANPNNFFLFNAAISDGTTSYTGTGAIAVSLYGCQLELGSYPTSYIPTLGAVSTRAADSAILNDSAALPTAYPFTLFIESKIEAAGNLVSLLDSASSVTYYTLTYNGEFIATARTSGALLNATSGGSYPLGNYKVAGVFTSSSVKLFVNGALLANVSSPAAFSLSINDLLIGQLRTSADTGNRLNNSKTLIFKSELSDAEAIALTTL